MDWRKYESLLLMMILIFLAVLAVIVFGWIGRSYAGTRYAVGILRYSAHGATTPHAQYKYYLLECSRWPLMDGKQKNGVLQISSEIDAKRIYVVLHYNGRRYAVSGDRLGSREAGWHVYSARMPVALADVLATYPAICRHVRTWPQVMDLPLAARNWIKAKSVCHGVASIGGATLTEWPCWWQGRRAGFAVTSINALSPGVLYGQSSKAAVGTISAEEVLP